MRMTVSELIFLLNAMPKDSEVYVEDNNEFGHEIMTVKTDAGINGPVTTIKLLN